MSGTPTKLTPKAMKAIRSWDEAGKSLREIHLLLKEAGLPVVSAQRIGRILRPPGQAKREEQERQAETILSASLPDDASPLDHVRAQLREARRLVSETFASVRGGDFPATQWAALVGLTMKMQEHIAEQERRLPIKPEDDPSNEKLAEAIVAEVKSRIEDAEAMAGYLCPRCTREIARP